MKKLSALFIVLALVLTSCSSDDSNSSDATGDLVGIWTGVSVDYFGTTVTVVPGADDLVADFVGEAYDIDYTLTFTEDPNEIFSEGSYSIELTTTIMGVDQVDNVENLEFIEDSSSWSRDGDQLTTVSNGESFTTTILELTDSMLSLGLVQTQDVSQQGFDITTTINSVATYTR